MESSNFDFVARVFFIGLGTIVVNGAVYGHTVRHQPATQRGKWAEIETGWSRGCRGRFSSRFRLETHLTGELQAGAVC